MDPIRVKVHHGTNLWQAQRNLVGIGECGWVDDPWWFPMTPKYCLLGPKTQEGHLALTHKPDTFDLVMGLCSSWWCSSFPRCRWGEWNSCPFHHRDPNTYATSGHIPIWSQWAYFYGCHIWHQQCDVPLIHIDGVWFSLDKGTSCLGYHELANMWRLGGVVECHVGKASFAYAKLETIMFHCGWCPIGTLSIMLGCTLIFYFLLHCLMFWYYVSMGIPYRIYYSW
jgi:hypothetical protein